MACKFKDMCKNFNETAHYCAINYEAPSCIHAMNIRKAIKETMKE